MDPEAYETELTGGRAELAAVLDGVVEGLLAGTLRVGDDADAFAVEVPEELTLEVEFEAEAEERSLELELEWDADPDGGDIAPAVVEGTDDGEPATAGDSPDQNRSVGGAPNEEASEEGPADEDPPVATNASSTANAEPAGEPTAESGEDEPEAGESTTGRASLAAGEAEEPLPVGPADTPASLGRFELYRDRADEWRWRLRHRNGNVIASSGEGYTRKANAMKGLRSVMQNAPGASVEEQATDGDN